jgi:hypothetical protein
MPDKELATTNQSTSEEDLQELHGQLGRTLRNIIVGGEVVVDKEGLPVALTPSPAMLNVVRQYLKDNNVNAKPGTNKDINHLIDDLPFYEGPYAS